MKFNFTTVVFKDSLVTDAKPYRRRKFVELNKQLDPILHYLYSILSVQCTIFVTFYSIFVIPRNLCWPDLQKYKKKGL